MTFLFYFIILSIVNVVFSTVRSITTIKAGKTIASLISGGYFAFYNIVLVWTVADFPMWQKCLITFVCNVAGVWVVKFIEEKMQKDKLWKVEATIEKRYQEAVISALKVIDIPFNYIEGIGPYTIFNIFCSNKDQSEMIKIALTDVNAKYFVSESKIL